MPIEITDGRTHLTIEIGTRSHPKGDYWDGNWVVALIKAELPGFQVKFTNELHLSEFQRFYQDLKRLYTELKGTANLAAMEGFLEITAEADRRGRIHWAVEVVHPVGSMENEARLVFHMDSDQSYLPMLLRQMEAVLEQFPITGRP